MAPLVLKDLPYTAGHRVERQPEAVKASQDDNRE